MYCACSFVLRIAHAHVYMYMCMCRAQAVLTYVVHGDVSCCVCGVIYYHSAYPSPLLYSSSSSYDYYAMRNCAVVFSSPRPPPFSTSSPHHLCPFSPFSTLFPPHLCPFSTSFPSPPFPFSSFSPPLLSPFSSSS